MLNTIDRVQLVVPDRTAAAKGWVALLGAELERDDKVSALACRRAILRLGTGCVEILEPDGAGPVSQAVAERGGHLFAGGATTADVGVFATRLRERGLEVPVEAGQAFLDPGATGNHGLRLVVSPDEPREPVGVVAALYEVTNLVADAPAVTADYSDLFGLDATSFEPISSSFYGYEGTLTLFDHRRLDRLEVITPQVPDNTMGRFFARFGESLYMAFAESGDLELIEERAREAGAGYTAVPPEPARGTGAIQTIFLHPPALGGMMLGLSRPTQAWQWSGKPERVEG
ncbi:MAG: hypothetical protein JJLCMIEE_01257 [Acidimicrobiales bacterium]|nr:MAG: hypothetical protein EDR02_07135 [Actinomycetota bacterium]MBV6508197.1 hypothetical protein [Acidimicrobiales bacterium]RIK07272.1 MAG: hypothetical protein DCC48_04115 [Acidobacteriota bacterium]